MNSDFLVFDHVTKRFGALTAVNDISLSVKKGEFFSLLDDDGVGQHCVHAVDLGQDQGRRGPIGSASMYICSEQMYMKFAVDFQRVGVI